jgi:hypothetical protein
MKIRKELDEALDALIPKKEGLSDSDDSGLLESEQEQNEDNLDAIEEVSENSSELYHNKRRKVNPQIPKALMHTTMGLQSCSI